MEVLLHDIWLTIRCRMLFLCEETHSLLSVVFVVLTSNTIYLNRITYKDMHIPIIIKTYKQQKDISERL